MGIELLLALLASLFAGLFAIDTSDEFDDDGMAQPDDGMDQADDSTSL